MLEHLTAADFDAVYRLMRRSFPPDEYRSERAQRALLEHPAYRIYGSRDAHGCVQAFLSVWDLQEFAFIEHFAVEPALRGCGLGGALLRELLARLGKRVCLEVEPPPGLVASRRIGFYRRNGFSLNPYPYLQPPMSEGGHAVPLLIMTSHGTIRAAEFARLRACVYAAVYRARMDGAKLRLFGGDCA